MNAWLPRVKEWLKGLFPHATKTRVVLTLFTLLVFASFATQCRGDDLTAEVGSTIVRGPAPAILLTLSHPQIAGDASLDYGLVLVGGSPDRRGVMGARVELVDGFGPVDFALGVVYLNHTDDLNGSLMNFSLKVAWNVTDRWSVSYRHFSNSGTQPPNTGRDMVLIGYRF